MCPVTVEEKKGCPLGGQCNSKNVVYQACISPMEHNNVGKRVYIGISAGIWKQGLYNHRYSFSNPQLRNQIAQCKYFLNLKHQRLTPEISWKIVRKYSTRNSFNGKCNLCVNEKISIINFKDHRLLLMNVTNLCLNVDIMVNLNYPDWGPPSLLL